MKVLNRITDLGTRSFSLINSEDVEIFARGCDYIYECLQDCKYQQSIELESALWEEREKAIKILSEGQEIEKIIKEAENYAFFNGAIRFLFLDESGEIDWNQFEKKYTTAKLLFNAEGLREDNDEKDEIIRKFISHCHYWGTQIEREVNLFSHKSKAWRSILLASTYAEPVHQLLLNNTFASELNLVDSASDIYRKTAYQTLVDGAYLECINEELRDSYFVRWYDTGMCLYSRGRTGDTYFLSSERLFVMHELSQEFVVSSPKKGRFYSRACNFDVEYKGYTFRLQHWGWTDMYADGKRLYDIEGLRDNYETSIPTVLIDPRHNNSFDDIKSKLDKLIENYETGKAEQG